MPGLAERCLECLGVDEGEVGCRDGLVSAELGEDCMRGRVQVPRGAKSPTPRRYWLVSGVSRPMAARALAWMSAARGPRSGVLGEEVRG